MGLVSTHRPSPTDTIAHSTCFAPCVVSCLQCTLVQLGCHTHLLCLRPLFWFGHPKRGPREPYVKTTTAWDNTGHELLVLFMAALPNSPNSPSSHLTGSVLTAAEPAAPAVLAICPLFHRHSPQRHILVHDLLQPWKYVETLFRSGLCDVPPVHFHH